MFRDRFSERIDWEVPKGGTLAVVTTAVLVVVLSLVVVFDVAVANRGIGVLEPLSPSLVTVLAVAGVVTQLGDPWLLLILATAAYLVGSERWSVRETRDGAFVLAVTFAAFSLIDVLKNSFAAPRPPGAESVMIPEWFPAVLAGGFRSITTGTGYAFPSGHALGTTAVFVALAYKLDVGPPLVRWSVAAAGIVLVVASRVVLGVHYFVDVAVGILAGISLVAVAVSIGDQKPLNVFGLGVLLGTLAVIASAFSPAGEIWKAGQWLGASLGAGLTWRLIDPPSHISLVEALVAGGPIALVWVAIYTTSPPLLVTVVGTAVTAGLTVLAPALVHRVRN